MSMSLNVPCNSVPRKKFPRDNVPRDNCSSRQLFHATIVPLDNCSSWQLFLATINPAFLYKEDGPPNDKNQGGGGARIVTNDHPYDPASFVPLQMIMMTEERELLQMIIPRILRSFANGLLQRGLFFRQKSKGWRSTDCCKWPSG